MANKNQLKILRQGVDAWNAWREEHPDAEIDLRWANLDELDLSGANFRKADIRGASFRDTVLVNSDFTNSKIGIPFSCYIILLMAMSFIGCIYMIAAYDFGIDISISGIAWRDYIITLIVSFVIKLILSLLSIVAFMIIVACLAEIYISITDYTGFYLETNFSSSDLTDVRFDSSMISLSSVFANTTLLRTSFQNVKFLLLSRRKDGGILCDNDVCKVLADGNGQKLDELSLKGKKLQGAYLVGADLGDMDLRETYLMQADLSEANISGAKLYASARDNWCIDSIRCDYVYWDEAGEQRTPPDRNFRPGEFEELYKQLPTFDYIFRMLDQKDKLINQKDKILDVIKQLGESKMGDTYNNYGQVAAMGKEAIATGNTFQQIINDLSRLHEEMQRTASNPEQQAAAQDVAKAEQAAQQEDEPAMRQHLKNAGQWTLDCAQKIGTEVVTEYLKKMTTGM